FQSSIASISKNSPSLSVYHVINPSSETEFLIRSSARPGLIFLIERTSGNIDKSYYACGRFFASRYLLELLKVPLFVLDIDCYIVRDFSELMFDPKWDRDNVAARIVRSDIMTLPWQRIVANSTFIPAREAGRSYLYWVCRYINYAR